MCSIGDRHFNLRRISTSFTHKGESQSQENNYSTDGNSGVVTVALGEKLGVWITFLPDSQGLMK